MTILILLEEAVRVEVVMLTLMRNMSEAVEAEAVASWALEEKVEM